MLDVTRVRAPTRSPYSEKDLENEELMNMDSSKYQKLDKYQVKLTFDSLSPVVFAIDSAEFHVDPNGPTSPQTGEISPVVVIAGMTIVAACAAAYVVRKEKAAR